MLGPRQLALPVEFLFEILYVEPRQLAHYCKLTFRQLLRWARQYNTLGPTILIYVSGSNSKILIIYLYNLSPFDAITCLYQ